VGVQQQLLPVGDENPLQLILVIVFQLVQLPQKRFQMHNNPIPDQIYAALVDHPTRQKMKREFLPLNDQSVSSVLPPVEPLTKILFGLKDINEFPLTLVAPLGA